MVSYKIWYRFWTTVGDISFVSMGIQSNGRDWIPVRDYPCYHTCEEICGSLLKSAHSGNWEVVSRKCAHLEGIAWEQQSFRSVDIWAAAAWIHFPCFSHGQLYVALLRTTQETFSYATVAVRKQLRTRFTPKFKNLVRPDTTKSRILLPGI